MSQNVPAKFVKNKIDQLPQALLFSFCNSMLKIPVQIVNPLFVDEFCQIWLVVPSPKQKIYEFEREFPSKLDFYQKGKNFYLKVSGKASIVIDPEELDVVDIPRDVKRKVNNRESMLLRIKVHSADYFETPAPRETSWFNKVLAEMQHLFYHSDQHFGASKRKNFSFA
ncbi:MAG TPA: hypothetical protein VK543_09105 [Puia sp.]|nr:hypothetical protein [Puia sp.]